jgi:FkbM family methyltransferase
MKGFARSVFRALGYEIVAVPSQPRSRCRAIGGHERLLRDFRARGFLPSVILDVGANRGEWARMAATVFPESAFILIEPQFEMHAHLESFVRSHPQSFLHRVAVGAEEDILPMTIWPGGDGSTFLFSEAEARAANCERRDIRVRTINNLLPETHLGTPEFAKLDIQGFEIEALKGASSLMGVTEVIVLEVSLFIPESRGADFAVVVQFMNDNGYKLYDFCGFLPRPHDGALGQVDAVFVRSEGRFRTHLRWQ